jgi:hypothetical protein
MEEKVKHERNFKTALLDIYIHFLETHPLFGCMVILRGPCSIYT